MQDFSTIIDFISRVLTVLIAIGGVLSFLFRRWLGAWIDARFKRQIDKELKTLEHQFASEIEIQKAALAKEFASETERLKSSLATDLERAKRGLDEEYRRKATFFDSTAKLYETFRAGYMTIFTELHAMDTGYIDIYNEAIPKLGDDLRDSNRRAIHRTLVELQEKLLPFQAYTEPELNRQVAELFRDMSLFLSEGASDKQKLDDLSMKESLLSVQLQAQIMKI